MDTLFKLQMASYGLSMAFAAVAAWAIATAMKEQTKANIFAAAFATLIFIDMAAS